MYVHQGMWPMERAFGGCTYMETALGGRFFVRTPETAARKKRKKGASALTLNSLLPPCVQGKIQNGDYTLNRKCMMSPSCTT